MVSLVGLKPIIETIKDLQKNAVTAVTADGRDVKEQVMTNAVQILPIGAIAMQNVVSGKNVPIIHQLLLQMNQYPLMMCLYRLKLLIL